MKRRSLHLLCPILCLWTVFPACAASSKQARAPRGTPSSADYDLERESAYRAEAAEDAGGFGDEAPGAPPAPPPEPAAVAVLASPPQDSSTRAQKAVEDPQRAVAARQIIYTATMAIAVFNMPESIQRAEQLPDKYGGYLQSMNGNALVLRVPAEKLREAMDEVAEFGVVESRTLTSQDVTAEFTDIETRIRVLEETRDQLLQLLTKARTVTEALQVRKSLDKLTMELEVLKGRIRQLKSQVAFSTLSLQFIEKGPHTHTPSSNDPFPWVNELGVEATEWN